MQPKAQGARNYTQCDSLLIGDRCGAHTVPYIEIRNPSARVEHEATTSKISEDQMFYCLQRGLSQEDALSLIVNGFCKEVLEGAADGVRRRGAEAAGGEPRGKRRVMTSRTILLPLPRAGEGRGEGNRRSLTRPAVGEIALALTLTLSRTRERE